MKKPDTYICNLCQSQSSADYVNGIAISGDRILTQAAEEAKVHLCVECMGLLQRYFETAKKQ